jgi:hypothetical protein
MTGRNLMKRLHRLTVAAALAVALSAAVSPADAAGNNWKTLAKFEGGKLQACKVATTSTGPWTVRLRVDSRNASTAVRGVASVRKGEAETNQHWESGFIAKGKVSAVGKVKLHRGSVYVLDAGLGGHQAGTGDTFTAGQIRHC